jgi:hypothetical protein
VNIAVQFIVDIVVADILQGSTAGRALEAFHVEILLLDPDEDASEEKICKLMNMVVLF